MLSQLFTRKKVLFSDRHTSNLHVRLQIDHSRYIPYFASFQVVDLDDYDILIPQTMPDIFFLRENKPELHGKKCFIPCMHAINLCDDKLNFYHFMMDHGYGEMVPQIGGDLPFPYILKKRIDAFGTLSRIINSSAEEKVFKKYISSDDYFRQECISDPDEYSTHILMVGGKVVYHRTLRFRFDKSLFVKGIGCKPTSRGSEVPSNHISVFEEILAKIEFEGICCYDYKLVNGLPKVFEINPRYGGSLTRSLSKMMRVYSMMLEE